ncbi:tail fiber protein [Xanthomonas phage Carpasina]|uniref:Tail fiber protein n=1 Tax=Xanthomonas phage Carpasina TaxID=2163636 RepID=A0A2S1GSU9_9CAUD|nr:tail protein [Xanthomonas phage Carpasina]AWD92426.1 tail fiber protein [Xanthomonas phage Carpasina]
MASPDLIIRPFAESGEKQAPPQSDPNGFVNFSQGYTEDYEVDLNSGLTTAKAVERDIQNYLFHLLTGAVQAWQQMSISPWYAEMTGGYSAGAVVGRPNSSGAWQIWRSTADNNVSDPIASGQTSWEYVPFNSEIVKSVAMPAGGTALIVPGGTRTEVVTVAADFNSFINGTWEFQTDSVANSSANSPVQLGAASALAGMLESKSWVNGATSYTVQRYVDRSGNAFYRGATNTAWTKWTSVTQVNNFSIDTSGAANLIQGNALLSSLTLSNNQSFWVQIANSNTGATTFSPNPSIAAKQVVTLAGNPLAGLELFSGGRAFFTYNQPGDVWNLITCTLSPATAAPARRANQLPNVTQVIDFSSDTSDVVNVVRGAGQLYGNPGSPIDGQKWTIRVANSNNGSVTLSPNPSAPLQSLVGADNAALRGGELVAGNEIVVMYRAATTRYVLLKNQGGAQVGPNASQPNQLVNAAQLNTIRQARFTANGAFTVPAGVNRVSISGCGAGAGGGGGGTRNDRVNASSTATATGGGGGGAGQPINNVQYAVTPGSTLTITVGAGGAAGSGGASQNSPGSAGFNGGASIVSGLIAGTLTLSGGLGGNGGDVSLSPASGVPGGVGFPSGGDSLTITSAAPYGAAGAGASGPYGGGGSGGRCAGDTTTAGKPAFGFGAGGGGGGGLSNTSATTFGQPGGAGMPGIIIIEW